jgi:hypothetical protein
MNMKKIIPVIVLLALSASAIEVSASHCPNYGCDSYDYGYVYEPRTPYYYTEYTPQKKNNSLSNALNLGRYEGVWKRATKNYNQQQQNNGGNSGGIIDKLDLGSYEGGWKRATKNYNQQQRIQQSNGNGAIIGGGLDLGKYNGLWKRATKNYNLQQQ